MRILSRYILKALVLSSFTAAGVCAELSAPVGPSKGCVRPPLFVKRQGIQSPAFSTSNRTKPGLILFDAKAGEGSYFQDPSWRAFGWLGPFVLDRAGNTYVAPIPHVSVLPGRGAEQNTVLKVSTQNGIMKPFLALPVAGNPSAENPYGVVGLAYDCDTDLLYAASLSGSTRAKEAGEIFGIDLKSSRIVTSYKGIDAVGLTIFNSIKGKRLLLGAARKSKVMELPLSPSGGIEGVPRDLFGFDQFDETKVRKFVFKGATELLVETIEFNFNLIASTELTQRHYRYSYDQGTDRWNAID